MGYVRVSQRMMTSRVLNDLNYQTRQLLKIQDQLSTGQRINAPSDDPISARSAINTRAIIQKSEQYEKNIDMTGPLHLETSSTIQTVVDILRRVHELTIQGGNGTNTQDQLNYISEEVNQLLEAVVDNANHITNGRYIFAGTRSLSEAFTVTNDPVSGEITAVNYNGNDEQVNLGVSDRTSVTINEPGSTVFQGATDIFQMLINIRDDLRSGNQSNLTSTRLEELDNAQSQCLGALARVGAAQNRVSSARAEVEEYISHNQELLSLTIDADYAETYVNLSAQQNAYQAALNAASRVLQPSLLDFLR